MKTRVLTALALVGAMMTSAAYAATTTVSTIKEMVPDVSVTLEDGTTYMLTEHSKDVKLDAFKVGDKVSLIWETDGTAHEIVSIAPAK
ncbi:hypothetical protein MASR1M32_04360 [Rhodobacter sp.]